MIVLLLLSASLAKYEDLFGKVYDWKREGQSKLRDAIAGADSTLLLLEDGISVKDVTGTIYSIRED